MSINENIYASTPVDSAFPLDIGLIERIEVIRGPSASIYGGDAMFGVINVVTRSGQAFKGGQASLSLGSGADRRLRASWGGQVGGNEVLISATGFNVHGRTLALSDVTADGSAQDVHRVGGENGGQLFIKTRGADWHISIIHAQRDRIVPTASYGTIADDHGHVEADRYELFQFAKDWKLNATNALHQRFHAGSYAYDAQFPYDYLPADPRVINVDKARGNWWGVENRLVNTGWAGQRWTLGLEYKANTRQDQINHDQGYGCFGFDASPCLDNRQQSSQLTFIAQDEIQLGAASFLTVGLRYDNLGSLGKYWSPRLGIVHDTGPAGLFKILWGTAFRTTSVYERGYIVPTQVYGNPGLSPEKLRSLEFAWEKRFSPQSRLTAAVYRFQIEKMVTVDSADRAINGSPINGNGLELEFEQQWGNGSRLRAGYTLQRAAAKAGSLDNSPTQMFKLNLAVPTGITHLMAGFEGQWIGARQANFGTERIAPYTLANLNLSYIPSGKSWEVSVGIYNLFDHRYSDPVAVDNFIPVTRWQLPQVGRSVRMSATVCF